MEKGFDHAAWKIWCASWEGVNFDAYPNFHEWQNAGTSWAQSAALDKVLNQAITVGDIKMVRKVYYHAPYNSDSKKRSLRLTLAHALETKDALLARDVWQHAGSEGFEVQEEANKAYEQITGKPYSR